MDIFDLFSQQTGFDATAQEHLFKSIASDLTSQGLSIQPAAVPMQLTSALLQDMPMLQQNGFKAAGIGRADQNQVNQFVRTDSIQWIDSQTQSCIHWNLWINQLQSYLNQHLFLGLRQFESHFASYAPGAFYKRHYDAFKGQKNRILSIVTYLNSAWPLDAGGELVIYQDDDDMDGIKVAPLLGTLVVFLSEDFPHEVLPATQERLSIAGWFRY